MSWLDNQPSNKEGNKQLEPLLTHNSCLKIIICPSDGQLPTLRYSTKYLLDKGHKPTIEQQKHLNPTMKEVVKKEILMWVDAGIICPIKDSSWVSPVQCIPKRGGTAVVPNQNNELIPSRIVTG